ncbi:MAG: hypothetical protein IJ124_09405 [Clostridia bacterium]|nr:hypothetical protein [Clostridia bacterium]MBQ8962784.1 hypothetical protein [Clostridia bacterium]
MKKRMLLKLKSVSGESIGETLISLLISALALVMLAGAISSASNIINNSKTAMETYYGSDEAKIASNGKSSVDGWFSDISSSLSISGG